MRQAFDYLVVAGLVALCLVGVLLLIMAGGCHYDSLINIDLRRMPSCASEAGLEARGSNPGPASRPADDEGDVQTGDEIIEELINGRK
jgi:hypothetical protein